MKNVNEKVKTNSKQGFLKTRLYQFVIQVIRMVDQLPREQSASIISHQLLRAATSIAANYIEAQAASSKRDFTNFFHHALKSCNETKFWLALLRDTGKASAEVIDPLLNEAIELSNILGKSIVTLKSSR